MPSPFNLIPELDFSPEQDSGPRYVLVTGSSPEKLSLEVSNYLETSVRAGHWVCYGSPFCTPLGTFVQAMLFKPNKGARKSA